MQVVVGGRWDGPPSSRHYPDERAGPGDRACGERTLAVLRSPPRCSRGHTPSMETAIAFETAAALRGRCVASSQPAVLLALLLALPLLLLL